MLELPGSASSGGGMTAPRGGVPSWAVAPPGHVEAMLVLGDEKLRLDVPGKAAYKLGRLAETCDIHIKVSCVTSHSSLETFVPAYSSEYAVPNVTCSSTDARVLRAPQNPAASRLHAIVGHHKEGGLCIMDHNSANGTFIGNLRTRIRGVSCSRSARA